MSAATPAPAQRPPRTRSTNGSTRNSSRPPHAGRFRTSLTPRPTSRRCWPSLTLGPSPPVQTKQAERSPHAPGPLALSRAARHLAADKNVDVAQVAGTGRGGRVMKEDVLKHLRHHPAQLEFGETTPAALVKPQAELAKP